jgi:uncharacterized membrane protein
MTTGRLEAFSDGVIAIIITIMVLEMKVPQSADLAALRPLIPVFLSYVLSFFYVGIYWNNHHHLLHACETVTGPMLWANLHFLFWLSLFPFVTGWMGQNHFASTPSAIYGFVLLMAAVSWWILQRTMMAAKGSEVLEHAVGRRDWKGNLSRLIYVVAIIATIWSPWLSQALYAGGALLWLVPDRRIEHALEEKEKEA